LPVIIRSHEVLHADGQTDVATICKTLGLSRVTLYRYLPPAE